MSDNNLPEFLKIAQSELEEAKDYLQFLLELDPVPPFDVEDTAYQVEQAEKKLRLARRSYESLPEICPNCGSDLVADGNRMRCVGCGRFYYPEVDYDPIPF